MPDPIQHLYSQRETVLGVLRDSRKMFGSTETTRKQYEAMQRTLALCLLYCPDDLSDLVVATLEEAELRLSHYELHVW